MSRYTWNKPRLWLNVERNEPIIEVAGRAVVTKDFVPVWPCDQWQETIPAKELMRISPGTTVIKHPVLDEVTNVPV